MDNLPVEEGVSKDLNTIEMITTMMMMVITIIMKIITMIIKI